MYLLIFISTVYSPHLTLGYIFCDIIELLKSENDHLQPVNLASVW